MALNEISGKYLASDTLRKTNFLVLKIHNVQGLLFHNKKKHCTELFITFISIIGPFALFEIVLTIGRPFGILTRFFWLRTEFSTLFSIFKTRTKSGNSQYLVQLFNQAKQGIALIETAPKVRKSH